MRQSTLIKIVVSIAAVVLFGFLFIRTARNVGAQPYTLARAHLSGWTVALDPAAAVSGALVALWPPGTMAPPLFSQLFTRTGVSLSGPNPVGMPLVLQREFDQAMAGGAIAPDELVTLARGSGLEAVSPKPLCMASRRVSEPGLTREVFFIRFEHASFGEFRRRVSERVSASGAPAGRFEPDGLSPIVIVAATDGNFASWLPLQGGATQDCLAPIAVQ